MAEPFDPTVVVDFDEIRTKALLRSGAEEPAAAVDCLYWVADGNGYAFRLGFRVDPEVVEEGSTPEQWLAERLRIVAQSLDSGLHFEMKEPSDG